MEPPAIQIPLADDDLDDCLLFNDALEALPFSTKLTTVNDEEQLMKLLHVAQVLSTILFL